VEDKHLVRRYILVVLSFVLIFSLVGLSRPAVHAQGGTVVRLVPATAQVGVGEAVPVQVVVDNVTNLFGVEVHLTFNPALLEVVDADSGTDGIQVSLGPFLSVEFVAQNTVDAAAGRVDFGFSQVTAVPRSGSGTIATITFRGKAAGSSPLNFTNVILADQSGGPIAATAQSGAVNVGGSTPTPTVVPSATPTVVPTPTPTPAPGTAVLSFHPSPANVGVGQEVQVALRVQNATNLYGVEVHVVHDSGIDAVAITPGTCVKDVVAQRSVEGNRIDYAASLRAPSAPFNGTCDLAFVTIRGVAAGAGYRLSFSSALLSDPNGRALAVSAQNGVVNVSPSSTSCTDILGYHVVRRGETLYAIGRAYKVRPDAIARCNNITNPSRVLEGTRLAIPNVPWSPVPPGPTAQPQFGGGTPACRYYHTVQAGENLYRISLRYGVSMWAIAQANRILNLNYIRVGQVLCIP